MNFKGYGWIREGMVGTAPATHTSPTGAANVWRLLSSLQSIPPKIWGDCSEGSDGGNNTEVKLHSDISHHSRYSRTEPKREVSDILEHLVCSSPRIRWCLMGPMLNWVPVNCPFFSLFSVLHRWVLHAISLVWNWAFRKFWLCERLLFLQLKSDSFLKC